MAFNPDDMNLLFGAVGGGGIRAFGYTTASVSEIFTAGYFTNFRGHGARRSDLVFITDSGASGETIVVVVSAIDAAGNATVITSADASLTLEWAADVNGTIAAGGVAQQAVAANPLRARLVVSVPLTAADAVYIGLGTTAVVGIGDPIGPGQAYDSGYPVSLGDRAAVSVISATTGVAYKVKQKVFA